VGPGSHLARPRRSSLRDRRQASIGQLRVTVTWACPGMRQIAFASTRTSRIGVPGPRPPGHLRVTVTWACAERTRPGDRRCGPAAQHGASRP
jgi:hypothetical protein